MRLELERERVCRVEAEEESLKKAFSLSRACAVKRGGWRFDLCSL